MTWHTDPPRRQCKCIVLDTWHNLAVAVYRPELGWWDGKCWRREYALCWIPALGLLGLHKWKPHCVVGASEDLIIANLFPVNRKWSLYHRYYQTECRCRRCGKRVSL